MKPGENLKEIKVTMLDGTVETHVPNNKGDDLVASMQNGLYLVGDRVRVVETANGFFRKSDKNIATIVKGPEQFLVLERVMYSPQNIVKINVKIEDPGYDSGLILAKGN